MIVTTATASWYKQRKVWLRALQLTPFFWIIFWFLFTVFILFPFYRRALANLETEFNRITPPTQSQLIEYRSQSTNDRASITADYSTELDYDAMREFYDKAFTQNGWSYFGEDNNQVDYCKGNYTASLLRYKIYPGSSYSLWFRIGITSDCEMSKGGRVYIPFYELVFLFGCSTTFLIPYAIVLGWASWGMKRSEYLRFRNELISKPKSVTVARLWAITSLLAGLLGLSISTYKIMTYLINW